MEEQCVRCCKDWVAQDTILTHALQREEWGPKRRGLARVFWRTGGRVRTEQFPLCGPTRVLGSPVAAVDFPCWWAGLKVAFSSEKRCSLQPEGGSGAAGVISAQTRAFLSFLQSQLPSRPWQVWATPYRTCVRP